MALARVAALTRHLAPALPRRSVAACVGAVVRPVLFTSAAGARKPRPSLPTPLLPPQSASDAGRLTVILDMDETLLHSELDPLPSEAHIDDPRSKDAHHDAGKLKPEIEFFIGSAANGGRERVRTSLRPGLRQFLAHLSAHFEPILFTSAMPVYASPLLDRIEGRTVPHSATFGQTPIPPAFPDHPFPPELLPIFRHRLYRSATVRAHELDYDYVKDVSPERIGRPAGRVVLVDNSWHACVHNPDNSLIVPDWLAEKGKEERGEVFGALLRILEQVKDLPDVRPVFVENFKVRERLMAQGFKFPKSPPIDKAAPAKAAPAAGEEKKQA